MESDQVDLLYIAKNRLAFTRESFNSLLENTNPCLVRTLQVYDDGSVDGTLEWLERACTDVILLSTRYGSPVTAFNCFIKQTVAGGAPYVAKVDNDTMLPPRWLETCLQVLEDHPELQCLGLEAFNPVDPDTTIERTYSPYPYTGGIGVFRREIFESFPVSGSVYYGLQIWQERQKFCCGWLNPALPVFLLDHLAFEPWRTLSRDYIRRGWQRRQWGEYGEKRREGYHDHGPELWAWRFGQNVS